MTGTEVARAFGAKRIGKGKWLTRCTVHPDKHPSLYISEGKIGVVLKCQSNHCDVRDIVSAVGLRMRDLFYSSRDSSSAQLREIYRQRRFEEQERRVQDLKGVMEAVEFGNGPRRKTRFECDIERFCARLSK